MRRYFLSRPHIQPQLRLTIEDDRLADGLTAYFEGFLIDRVNPEAEDISILGTGPVYRFVTAAGTVPTEYPIAQLADEWHRRLCLEEGWTGLHAAGLVWKRHAFLFAAATTTGKTTLTAYLLHEGFGYLSDDCVTIHRQTLTVVPSRNTLHLRAGGREILRQLGALPSGLRPAGEPGAERFVYTPPAAPDMSYPIGGIFLLERSTENRLLPLSQSDAMPLLMKNAMVHEKPSAERLRFWLALSARPIYHLYYREMAFVAACIKEAAVSG